MDVLFRSGPKTLNDEKKTFWQVQAFQKKAEKRPKSGNAQKKENIKNEQKEKHFFYGKGVFWGVLKVYKHLCQVDRPGR